MFFVVENCHYLPSSGPFLAPIQNPEIATNRFNKVALKSLKDINSVNISKRYLVILSNSIVHKSNKGGETQNKCNHETKKCPNNEPTTSNKKAKTNTHREKAKMKRQTEYKEIYSDKGKTRGQKEVEQMKGTREMSNEERKQSKKKQKKEERQDDTHRNIT